MRGAVCHYITCLFEFIRHVPPIDSDAKPGRYDDLYGVVDCARTSERCGFMHQNKEERHKLVAFMKYK